MSIVDHEAILLVSSLDQARPNKINRSKVEFFALAAFPPAAGADLADAMNKASPSGNLNGMKITVEANGKKAKPFASIPADWLVVRLSGGPDFPPDLFGTGGQIAALPINGPQIRTEFYAGQRVRINGYPFYWKHDESRQQGISWNLSGVMALGGGERRAAGSGEDSATAFAKYGATLDSAPVQSIPTPAAQQSAPATGANPFQQGSGSATNPFG